MCWLKLMGCWVSLSMRACHTEVFLKKPCCCWPPPLWFGVQLPPAASDFPILNTQKRAKSGPTPCCHHLLETELFWTSFTWQTAGNRSARSARAWSPAHSVRIARPSAPPVWLARTRVASGGLLLCALLGLILPVSTSLPRSLSLARLGPFPARMNLTAHSTSGPAHLQLGPALGPRVIQLSSNLSSPPASKIGPIKLHAQQTSNTPMGAQMTQFATKWAPNYRN